jgi:hypothetical protein
MDDFSHDSRAIALSDFDTVPMMPWKGQHNFALPLGCLRENQDRAILGKISAEHASDVEQ